MAEPGHAVAVDDDVVRLDLGAGQVEFGDDDPGGAAGGAGEGLDREGAGGAAVQVHAGEVFGDRGLHPGGEGGALVAVEQALRLHVGGAGVVAAHALDDLQELRLRMLGVEDALQGVAVRAVQQLPLQVVGARGAGEPFGVGEGIRGGGVGRRRRLATVGVAAVRSTSAVLSSA